MLLHIILVCLVGVLLSNKLMTLCSNFQRKWGVGVFSEVGIFSRGYGNRTLKFILAMVLSFSI